MAAGRGRRGREDRRWLNITCLMRSSVFQIFGDRQKLKTSFFLLSSFLSCWSPIFATINMPQCAVCNEREQKYKCPACQAP